MQVMLSDLCFENILSQIDRLPPYMKEMIIDKVNEREREKMMIEASDDVCQQMMKIVPRIRKDVRAGLGYDMHFLSSKYPDINLQVLEAAVDIVLSEPRMRRSRKE